MIAHHTPVFDHLVSMTDERGLFEHADHAVRRVEHGYCTDDNARLLVITAREPDIGAAAELGRVALTFTLDALAPDGRVRNRMDASGIWTDEPSTDDCWGRCLWGLGVAASHHDDPVARAAAIVGFESGARQRSPWIRSMVFAALGAAEVLSTDPTHPRAREILRDAATAVGPTRDAPWSWPERRLTYANAALAEVVIAAGDALDEPYLLDDGLAMLDWLLRLQTRQGHLSVSGAQGSDERTEGPEFDQQPIEVAAMADACARAFAITGEVAWIRGLELATAWFDGANDAGVLMWDTGTGGCFDGLEPASANRNQGAESTLALISTRQRARVLQAGAA